MLRQARDVSPVWIVATAAGLMVGFAILLTLVGTDMTATDVALRGLVTQLGRVRHHH